MVRHVYQTIIAVDPGLVNIGIAVYVRGQGFVHLQLLNVKHTKQRGKKGQRVDLEKLSDELLRLLNMISSTSSKEDTVILIENQGACDPGFQRGTISVEFSFGLVLCSRATIIHDHGKNKFSMLIDHKSNTKRVDNKKISVATVREWMKSPDGVAEMPQELQDIWHALKKKDDVSDAIMISLVHLGKLKRKTPEILHRVQGPRSKKARAEAAAVAATVAAQDPEAAAVATAKEADRLARKAISKAAKVAAKAQVAAAEHAEAAVAMAVTKAAEAAEAAEANAAAQTKAKAIRALKAKASRAKAKVAKTTAASDAAWAAAIAPTGSHIDPIYV